MGKEAEVRSTHVIHEKDKIGQVIIADEVFFVDSKNENPGAGQQSAPSITGAQPYVPDNYGAPTFTNADGDAPKFEEINDDELPF